MTTFDHIFVFCSNCAPQEVEELTIGGHKKPRCQRCGYEFAPLEQAFHCRSNGKQPWEPILDDELRVLRDRDTPMFLYRWWIGDPSDRNVAYLLHHLVLPEDLALDIAQLRMLVVAESLQFGLRAACGYYAEGMGKRLIHDLLWYEGAVSDLAAYEAMLPTVLDMRERYKPAERIESLLYGERPFLGSV